MSDEFPNPKHMRRAAQLAAMAARTASPNPMVGAVVVRGDEIVGEGFHERRGGPHAEAIALSRAGERARGADLYVTLEPCSHSGAGKLTPPCAPMVVACGIRRVAIGTLDPNPNVSGNGVRVLRESGIEASVGLESRSLAYLNRGFFSRMFRGRPWVTAKWAMSIDGRTAATNRESKWITSPISRDAGHIERAESDAVIVGIGTVLADNPMLTARDIHGELVARQPTRVVIDRQLRIPAECALVQSAREHRVVAMCGPKASSERRSLLESLGVIVVSIDLRESAENKTLDLAKVLEKLAAEGMNRVLIEGGAGLLGHAVDQRLVDESIVFVAPSVLIGGSQAHPAVAGRGAADMASARRAISTSAEVNAAGEVELRAQFTDPTTFVLV